MEKGWYQIAYERELTAPLTPLTFKGKCLISTNRDGKIQLWDGICPHRGASLGHGGILEGDNIVCPFHGIGVGLGKGRGKKLEVREYESLTLGGLVFMRVDEDLDVGFADFFRKLDASHYIVPGFSITVKAPPTIVIENAFDNMHFRVVHGIFNEPEFVIQPSQSGEFSVTSEFVIPPSLWQNPGQAQERLKAAYHARAFSPGIVISLLGGPNPYYVITTATQIQGGESLIRLSLAIPPDKDGNPPSQQGCKYLLEQSKKGLESDQKIWVNMDFQAVPSFLEKDASVKGFQEFCLQFHPETTLK